MADSNFVVKNGLTVNGSFTANGTAVNAAAITATAITVGGVTINSSTVNTAAVTANTITVGSVTINSSTINVGSISINSTAFTGNANNASFLGGTAAASYALLAGPTFTGTVTTGNTLTIGTAAYHVANGNFGVGTSSPSSKLDVNGGFFANGGSVINGVLTVNSALQLYPASSEGGEARWYNPDGVAIGLTVDVSSADVARIYSTRDNFVLQLGQLGSGVTGGYIDFYTETAVKARLAANGNLGIGTTSPSTKLDVYDATASQISVKGDSTTGFISARYSSDTTSGVMNFRKYRGSFASPSTVSTGDTVGLSNYSAYDGTALRVVSGITSTVGTYTTTDNVSGYLSFSTRPTGVAATNTERMRIDPDGNVGIGNTAPASKLHVQGAINGSFPRWKVTIDRTNSSRTTPNTFVATAVSAWPSFGGINWVTLSNEPQYSLLFEMSLYCTSSVTATQHLSFVDDNVYFWLNGSSVANVEVAGAKSNTITYNLVTGINTVQIVLNNSGGAYMGLNLWGDFLYRYSNVTFHSA